MKDLGTVQRYLVYGATGSGKTAAARRIGEATGIPWTEVDQLTWEPGWAQVPVDEQRRRIREVCAGEAWVLDTAYGVWVDLPIERAQLVVALDFPRWVSLSRLLRRTARRVATREQVCNGNVETLRRALSGDSIIWWHFRSFARKRSRIEQWETDPSGPAVVRCRTPRELDAFVTSLTEERKTA